MRHLGDLGNTNVHDYSIVFNTPFKHLENNFKTLSLVMHEKQDDLGMGGTIESLETGSSGGRVACSNMSRIFHFPWQE